jgi:hypothetical protein
MTFKGKSMMRFRSTGLGPVAMLTAALVFSGCGDDADDDAATTFEPDTDPTNGVDTDEDEDTGEDETGDTPDVTFAEVQPIFQQRCVDGCHEPGGLWATYDMTDIHASMVGVTGPIQGQQCNLIEPGDPERSYIWHKIVGTHTMNCGGSGEQMPVRADNIGETDPLPQDQIDLIEGWILAGAPS